MDENTKEQEAPELTAQTDTEAAADPALKADATPEEDAAEPAEVPETPAEQKESGAETPEPELAEENPAEESQTAKAESEAEETHAAETEKTSGDAEADAPKRLLCDVLDLVESVITSIFVVMLIFTFLFCIANVEGQSMEPTLIGGDRLLVSRLTKSYENGDILIVNNEAGYTLDEDGGIVKWPGLEGENGSKNIVKRLIAQGGQQVDIDMDEGVVYVDGTALDEPYTSGPTSIGSLTFHYPLVIPEGYVFVLGDNRLVSTDSRYTQVGLVPVESIVGKVVLRISPLSKFGFMN